MNTQIRTLFVVNPAKIKLKKKRMCFLMRSVSVFESVCVYVGVMKVELLF